MAFLVRTGHQDNRERPVLLDPLDSQEDQEVLVPKEPPVYEGLLEELETLDPVVLMDLLEHKVGLDRRDHVDQTETLEILVVLAILGPRVNGVSLVQTAILAVVAALVPQDLKGQLDNQVIQGCIYCKNCVFCLLFYHHIFFHNILILKVGPAPMDSQAITVKQDLVAQLGIPDNLVHLEHQELDLWDLPDQKDLQVLLVQLGVVAVSVSSHLNYPLD